MKKENSQRQNNIHIVKENIYKIPFKRENTNSRLKNKNLTLNPKTNSSQTSFNDKEININSKINSLSKEALPKISSEKRFKPRIKKGKSTTCLKPKNKNNVDIITNNHIKKNTNITQLNISNIKNNNDNNKTSNNNIKKSHTSILNTENNNYKSNNHNKNKNNNPNNLNEKKTNYQFLPKIASNIEEKSENVKVFIRFRPSNELETSLLQTNYGWLVPKFI